MPPAHSAARPMIPGFAALALMMTWATAQAGAMMDYTPGLLREELSAGRKVLLIFTAPDCEDCRMQQTTIDDWHSGDRARAAVVSMVTIDWKMSQKDPLPKRLGVSGPGTLVLLAPEGELGRVSPGDGKAAVTALLKQALPPEG